MHVWQQMEIGPYTVADISGVEKENVYAVRVQAKTVDGRYGNLSAPAILTIEDSGNLTFLLNIGT